MSTVPDYLLLGKFCKFRTGGKGQEKKVVVKDLSLKQEIEDTKLPFMAADHWPHVLSPLNGSGLLSIQWCISLD